MNHAIPGVNGGYITRHELLEGHLRSQLQAISSAVFAALGASITQEGSLQDWLGRGGSRRASRGAASATEQGGGLFKLNNDQSEAGRVENSTLYAAS
ncbi:hypothetical protein [Bradyrhizobium sp. Bra78]|uniref:hypothetical protein n=1 Tax=Bradyrhizobium sp. Bra78 TaxID=2926010 RepID=UPI0039679FFC